MFVHVYELASQVASQMAKMMKYAARGHLWLYDVGMQYHLSVMILYIYMSWQAEWQAEWLK